MGNHEVIFALLDRYYLGKREPILSHRIVAKPTPEMPSELEATTLLLLNGPSIASMNVSDDIRTQATWQPYGKLSLKKTPRGLEYLMDQRVGEPVRQYLSPSLAARVSAFLEGLIKYSSVDAIYNVFRGLQSESEKREASRMNWDLVFSGTADERVRQLKVGKISFSARKYIVGELSRGLNQFNRQTGIDTNHIHQLTGYAEDGCECLIMSQSYFVPEAVVTEVLNRKPLVPPNGEYPNSAITMQTTINTRNITPNIIQKPGSHLIYMITKIKGVEQPYVAVLKLEGPNFTTLKEAGPRI